MGFSSHPSYTNVQNLKFVALPVPQYSKKFGHSLETPTLPFLKILMGFCSDRPCECTGQILSPYSFKPVPDYSFGCGLRTSNLGKGGILGREWHRPKERL